MNRMLIAIALFATFCLQAQPGYQPSAENQEAREWFRDARFGLFIHWGVYSILGDGEWVMNNQNISVQNYEKLPGFFNPVAYDPEMWVKMAKDAGMKYITITSRHHDGFSMFDSDVTEYDIVDRTPYGKDVLKMLADACHREGIKLFFYYSLLDWRHPDYFPRGRTGKGIKGRPATGNWDDYIVFMKYQLTELLTNYGDIAGIWLDGHWDQVKWDGDKWGDVQVDWQYDELYPLIHQLQPGALIGNNHHLRPFEGEDFQMFERDLPGENTTGWGTASSDVGDLPFEMCETINGSWGFSLQDDSHKSPKKLIHALVRAAGHNSNLLLNVGPMPDGRIQPEHVESLAEVGRWMRKNGETIYGTHQGPVAPRDWGVSTQNGNRVFLHVLDWHEAGLLIQDIMEGVTSVRFFADGGPVEYKQTKLGLLLTLPGDKMDEVDTIIEIFFK